MKLVLFDCDGTLVDSAGFIQDCMVRSFGDFGHPPPSPAAIRATIGLTLDVAIAALLKREVDAEVAAMTARYKENFTAIRAGGAVCEPMFDGIRPLIDALSHRDEVVLGVVTGKARRGLAAVLQRHGLERTFLTTRTADDCLSKPHPAMVLECCGETGIAPAETIVVGDAVFDMQMAEAAGAMGIGVAWGYSTPDELLAAGAHAVVAAPGELTTYLEEPATMGA